MINDIILLVCNIGNRQYLIFLFKSRIKYYKRKLVYIPKYENQDYFEYYFIKPLKPKLA
jgi:hypothetical protein